MKPSHTTIITPTYLRTTASEGQAALFYCLRMCGAAVTTFALCALQVCTLFADVIADSPEAWLSTFSTSGPAGWGLLMAGGALTRWAHKRFIQVERVLSSFVVVRPHFPVITRE